MRDALHALGLPHLSPSSVDAVRVKKANQLYALSLDLALFCAQSQTVASIENPARSWGWAAMVQLLLHMKSPAKQKLYNSLERVSFHACMHGGARPKRTTLLCTPGICSRLCRCCVTVSTMMRPGPSALSMVVGIWLQLRKQPIHLCWPLA